MAEADDVAIRRKSKEQKTDTVVRDGPEYRTCKDVNTKRKGGFNWDEVETQNSQPQAADHLNKPGILI